LAQSKPEALTYFALSFSAPPLEILSIIAALSSGVICWSD
jgi:hypothetical protein